MNENIRFVVLIAIVVGAVGGAWYFFYGGKGDDTPEAPPVASSVAEPVAPETESVSDQERSVARPARPFQVSGDRTPATSPERGPRRTGAGTIKGTVKLADGEAPVPNATLRVVQTSNPGRAGGEIKDGPEWETEAGTDGSYRVDRLPFGVFVVLASTDDLFGVSGANLTDDEPASVTIVTMKPAGSISGLVVNEAGEPIAQARVFPEETRDEKNRMSGSTGMAAQVRTNDDGTFFLPHLWEGEWQLTVQADGYAVLASDYIPVGTMDAELVLSPGGSASGEVVAAETGEPIAGIKVTARGEVPRAENETETDEDGRFEIAHLAESKYTVNVDDDTRLVSGKAPEFTIAGGDTVDGLRLIVAVGGSVKGRAYDADTNKPLQGVKFSARPDSNATPRRDAESDANGVFAIEGLGDGPHTIRRHWKLGYLHGEDREDKKVNVQLGKTTPDIDFAMKQGLRVRGRVVDKDGNPVEHADVRSQPVNYNGEGESTKSREDGTFEHRGFSPNQKIQITAAKAGYSAAPVGPLDLGDTELKGIEIVMGSGGSIAGVAVDKMGKPMKQAHVMAEPVAGRGEVQPQGASLDADGKFKIVGLMAGTYRLRVQPYTSYSHSPSPTGTEVTVGEGEDVTGVQIVYEEAGGLTISGRVTNSSGQPVRHVNVHANMDRGGGFSQGNTDENGNYTLAGLQQGTYRVFAYHGEYSRGELTGIEAGSTNANFVLSGRGTVEGRVLSAKDGQPVTKFQVGAFPGQVDFAGSRSMYGNLTAFVDPQGNFKLTNVEAGEGYVAVFAEGFAPSQQPVTGVREGATVSGVVFRLDPGATIKGLVTDESGQPVSGARIYLGSAPMDQWRMDREMVATSNANGEFQITSVGPETNAISAVHGDFAPGNVPVQVSPGGTAQVTIRLGGGGTIEGRVTIAGQPAANHHIWIQRMSERGQPFSAQTDSDGMYSIKGVPEGQVIVSASAQQGQSSRNATQQAVVAENQVTIVDFDFAGGNASVEGYVTMDGQPLQQGHVMASIAAASGSNEMFNSQIDGNGFFRLEGLMAGTVTLRVNYQASENEWQTRTAQVSVADGRTARHDIEINAGATISGRVSGALQGQTSAAIIRGKMEIATLDPNFWMANQHLVVGGAMVQPDGTFRAGGIEPGDYTVVVVGFTGEPSPDMSNARIATEHITVSGDGEVAVNLTMK